MLYNEYLNSARKHQYTCQEILNCIKVNKNISGPEKSKHKQLVLNLYYITGYIIECSVKYAIYHLIGYDRKTCVKQLDQDGISFSNNMKFHKFERYVEHLKIRQPGLVLIDDVSGIERDIVFIYRQWDAEVRYWFNDIEESIKSKINIRNVEKLFLLASDILENVERI